MHGRGGPTVVVVLTLAATPLGAWAKVTIRDPGTYVVDQAGIVDSAVEQRLEAWLRELEEKTASQLKVLTVATTDGEPFFDFVQRHAELWRLGQRGKDNGALIALALREREVRIHPGYGLESVLPDSWCGSLSREVAGRYFKRGAYSEGLFHLAVATANKIADEANVTLTGMPGYRHDMGSARRTGRSPPGGVDPSGTVCGCGLMPLIVLLIIVSSVGRRARYYGRWSGGGWWEALVLASMMSRGIGGHRSSWGGGGFGGFGGGFGGGGGSFGGGGHFGGGGGGARW